MLAETRVAIVGGGISGLVAAFSVQQASRANGLKTRIDLFEASDRLGGKIGTEHVSGFLVEGGPDTFLSTKPAGLDLCRELGLANQVIPTRLETRQSYLSRGGVLVPLPSGMSGLVPRNIGGLLGTSLLSRRARLRACLERFVPGKQNGADESVFDFASRRFGAEMAERIVEPLLSGIYAGDGRALSAAASVPHLCAMEKTYRSVTKGMRKKSTSTNGVDSPFVSLTAGMGSLVARLEEKLEDVTVHTRSAVSAVSSAAGHFCVDSQSGSALANVVILATPAFHTAEMLKASVPGMASELAAIRFVSTATVSLGFKHAPARAPQHGYGYIVPRSEGTPVTACTWTTLKLPHRSSDGAFLLRIFIGRDGAEGAVNRTDDELCRMARDELMRTLGIDDAPSVVRVQRHQRAMPQYDVGHLDRLARIDAILDGIPGLFVAGCSYRGVGIPDCISSGRSAGLDAFRSLSQGVVG